MGITANSCERTDLNITVSATACLKYRTNLQVCQLVNYILPFYS